MPELYCPTANEPKVHTLIKKSFAFVPSAGMRLAPEVLVLELFREIFFREQHESSSVKYLDPDEKDQENRYLYSANERAVLYVLRGRRKKTRNAPKWFFAPAYPELARWGGLGKSRESIINGFLLSGPISQHLWSRSEDVEEKKRERDDIVSLIIKAFRGNNSVSGQDVNDKEILSVAIRNVTFKIDEQLAKDNLSDKTSIHNTVIRLDHDDELATRIFKDFKFICEMESKLPRMQWIYILMTFLRFALPMWLLAQMKITNLLHCWLVEAIDKGTIPPSTTIDRLISGRNRGLLHPTLSPTREVLEHIERYMKYRVELNILLYNLEEIVQGEIRQKELYLCGGGAGKLSVEKLLEIARNSSTKLHESIRFRSIAEGLDIQRFLTREGELFSAWRNPLLKGQGKNIDEFLRVMYRSEQGDEAGGYLLIPEGRGLSRGFRVFPGQLLLKTITYLADQDKRTACPHGGGKLILEDIEDHFQQYGIDFSNAADARPLLMSEMQAMGLLTGSPDAGSSVAVACPY